MLAGLTDCGRLQLLVDSVGSLADPELFGRGLSISAFMFWEFGIWANVIDVSFRVRCRVFPGPDPLICFDSIFGHIVSSISSVSDPIRARSSTENADELADG